MACPRGAKPGSGGRVDWEGRKEGGETGRNRGAAGSGIAGRVETGSGQRKAPQGEPYGGEGGEWPTINRCPLGRRGP